MTTREIVVEWLKSHGYDGLYDDECGCLLNDLMPCCGNPGLVHCIAGYEGICPDDCEERGVPHHHMGPEKPDAVKGE